MADKGITWGLYDELGHSLPQDPKEGPTKMIPHMMDDWKCDICSQILTTRTRLANHREKHFKPHKNDFFPEKTDEMKKKYDEEVKKKAAEKKKIDDLAAAAVAKRAKTKADAAKAVKRKERSRSRSPISHLQPERSRLVSPSSATGSLMSSNKKLLQTASGRGNELLLEEVMKRFTPQQISEELIKRDKLLRCHCGILFQDAPMFYLHRGIHHDENPLQCSCCKFVADDYRAFMVHFFKHK